MILTDKSKEYCNYILFGINGFSAGLAYILFQRYISVETAMPLFSLNRLILFFAIFAFVFWIFFNSYISCKKNTANSVDVIINKISTHPMFIALCLVVIIRIIYRSYFLQSTLYYDTKTYTDFGYNIFLGETDIFRTPGYPYFLKLIGLFVNNDSAVNTYVAVIQSFLSFLSVIILYFAGRKLFTNRYVLTFACFLYGIMPCVVNYDTCILTESLSLFCMVLLIYFVFSFIAKPKTYMAVIIGLYSFAMIMIKPAYIYFYAILGVFFATRFILNREDRKKCFAGILSLALSGIMLLGYCGLNYKNYGYFNISSVSVTVNKLFIVMDNNWTDNSDYPEITAHLSEKMNSIEYSNWIPEIIEKLPETYSYKSIDEYVNSCIKKHKDEFLEYNLKKVLNTSKSLVATQYSSLKSEYKNTEVSGKLDAFNHFTFPFTFGQCYLQVAAGLIYAVVVLVKKKRITWQVIGLCSIIFTHIFVSIYGAMMEWERLSVPIIPAVVLLVFYFADKCLSTVKYQITDNNSSKIDIKEVEHK